MSLAQVALYGVIVSAILASSALAFAIVRPAPGRISDKAIETTIWTLLVISFALCVAVVGLQGWDLEHLWQRDV